MNQPKPANCNNLAIAENSKVQSGRDGSSYGEDRCDCLHGAARFLVELGEINARMEHGPLDTLLKHFRQGLNTFGNLIECERCDSVTENRAFKVVAAQCLGTLGENVVKSYARIITIAPNSSKRESPSRTADEMWYSAYSIYDDDERQEVLRGIVSVQVKQLRSWLEKLKAGTSKYEEHALISETEKRLKRAVACVVNEAAGEGYYLSE
ncbi:hypothetical protein CFAM422_007027 [Trichoderma lentiforme]|uniref:Uncharacterized protein n=1 Tax=Trichoderma lentiforme TaxID=1567552 RepID=A0A9P4XDE5_9HYPO|nr:hypothetical protein CFAM422_007027 [Trichoderma lentiforme]